MATALIVDDDIVSRLVLRHMLNGHGFDVVEADSVESALVEVHTRIDLIVCDYQMPERNGLDLLENLDSPIPFVLLTGVLDRAELNDERVNLVTAYLTKPVSSDELSQVIASVTGPGPATTRIDRGVGATNAFTNR